MSTSRSMQAYNVSGSPQITWDSSAECHVVPYSFHALVGMFVGIVAIFAVVGNLLVLCTYFRYTTLRTSSNLFIISLAIADLLMSVIDFPIFSVSSFKGCWFLGYTGCQLYGATSAVAGLVTINSLAVISFDRYIVVVHRRSPLHRMSKSTTGAIIVGIWTFCIIWSVLPLIGIGDYRLEGMGTSCTFNYVDRSTSQRWFFMGLVTFNFFIPLLIIAFSYYKIFIFVKHTKRELELVQRGYTATGSQRKRTAAAQAEVKTAVAAAVIICIFCTAWAPYVIIAFVGLFGPVNSLSPLVSMFPNILAKVSTVSNPIIYSIGHPEVRKKMRKFLNAGLPEFSWRPTSATAGNSSPGHSEHVGNINMPTVL